MQTRRPSAQRLPQLVDADTGGGGQLPARGLARLPSRASVLHFLRLPGPAVLTLILRVRQRRQGVLDQLPFIAAGAAATHDRLCPSRCTHLSHLSPSSVICGSPSHSWPDGQIRIEVMGAVFSHRPAALTQKIFAPAACPTAAFVAVTNFCPLPA